MQAFYTPTTNRHFRPVLTPKGNQIEKIGYLFDTFWLPLNP